MRTFFWVEALLKNVNETLLEQYFKNSKMSHEKVTGNNLIIEQIQKKVAKNQIKVFHFVWKSNQKF